MFKFEFKPRKGYQNTIKHLEKIDKSHAEWGVYQENGMHPEAGVTYSELMAIHELRQDKWQRPAFKISTKKMFQIRYKKLLVKGLSDYIYRAASGKYENVDKVLKPVAREGRDRTYHIFGNNTFLVRNTQETINRKGHAMPLIETGELREKIRFKVVKGK